jgi:hypothetical protein
MDVLVRSKTPELEYCTMLKTVQCLFTKMVFAKESLSIMS